MTLFFAAGPDVTQVRWQTARDSEEALPRELRSRLGAFRRAIARGWCEPHGGVADGLRALFPGTAFLIDSGDPGSGWVLSSIGGACQEGWAGIKNTESIQFTRSRGRAAHAVAGSPVNLTSMAGLLSQEVLDRLWREVLVPNDLGPLMRAVLPAAGAGGPYVMIARSSEEAELRDFTLEELRLLHAALPAMCTWWRTARLLGLRPIGADGVAKLVEAFPEPCWIATVDRVVYLNAAARALAGPGLRELPPAIRRVDFGEPDLPLTLHFGAGGPSSLGRSRLPPYLRPVAAGLSRGASDKEIAMDLGLSIATARTYVTRVLAAYGARSRRELMLERRLLGFGGDAQDREPGSQ